MCLLWAICTGIKNCSNFNGKLVICLDFLNTSFTSASFLKVFLCLFFYGGTLLIIFLSNEIKLLWLIEPDRQILIFSVMTLQTLMKFPWICTMRTGNSLFPGLAAQVCALSTWGGQRFNQLLDLVFWSSCHLSHP